MIVSKDHFLYKHANEVSKISRALEQDSCVKFLLYSRQYDNGCFSSLTHSEALDWTQHAFENYLTSKISKHRFKTGINYWKCCSNEDISNMNQDARNNFDIDARIDFITRDNVNDCFHLYSFYSNKINADKAYSFYDLHRGKLLKFIGLFNRSAASLIVDSIRAENLFQYDSYALAEKTMIKRNYIAELKEQDASIDLSDREFEVLILYASGFSAKQIGDMFYRSQKTIETHIMAIYQKMDMTDRADLKKYVASKGWDGLEKFFFDYIN